MSLRQKSTVAIISFNTDYLRNHDRRLTHLFGHLSGNPEQFAVYLNSIISGQSMEIILFIHDSLIDSATKVSEKKIVKRGCLT